MHTSLKHSIRLASFVLVGVTAMGCGGADKPDTPAGPPTDASEKTFCDNLNSLKGDLTSAAGKSPEETIAALKSAGKSLEKVGTPKGIPADGRKGFELIVDQIAKLDDKGTQEDLAKIGTDLTPTEEKSSAAFGKYTTDTCGPIGSDAP